MSPRPGQPARREPTGVVQGVSPIYSPQLPLWLIAEATVVHQQQPGLKQMALVQTLIDCAQNHSEPALPPGLSEMYHGDLHFPQSSAERPSVIANFVSTLDGVVSYKIKRRAGGSTVSGSDSADRFIMGLLRASVDAVIVGAGTVHDTSPESLWIPEYTYPDAKLLFREYRVNVLHKPEYPLLVVVSGQWQIGAGESNFPNARSAHSGDHNLQRQGCS